MKKLLFLFIFVAIFFVLSGCNHSQKESQFTVINDLCQSFDCWNIYIDNIEWYWPEDIQQEKADIVDIIWSFDISQSIDNYFEENWREMDAYNIADWVEWSLVWYNQWDQSCSILSAWELDEEYAPSGSWLISVACFQN